MRQSQRDRLFVVSVGGVFFITCVLLALASYFRVWNMKDLDTYRAMRAESPPVWRDLNWQRINAGDNVDDVIAATNPLHVEKYGKYVRLDYKNTPSFSGLTILAKDGKLVCAVAWSCCWDKVFFDELSNEEHTTHYNAYRTHRDATQNNPQTPAATPAVTATTTNP